LPHVGRNPKKKSARRKIERHRFPGSNPRDPNLWTFAREGGDTDGIYDRAYDAGNAGPTGKTAKKRSSEGQLAAACGKRVGFIGRAERDTPEPTGLPPPPSPSVQAGTEIIT